MTIASEHFSEHSARRRVLGTVNAEFKPCDPRQLRVSPGDLVNVYRTKSTKWVFCEKVIPELGPDMVLESGYLPARVIDTS